MALAALASMVIGMEGVARAGFTRFSRIESRIHTEHQNALAIRPGGPAHPSLLLVGNSLLLDAIDPDALRQALEPRATPARFVIENTMYIDWFYGIKRLLDEGARPDRLILALDVPQLLEDGFRGEYSAYYLIGTGDLIQAGRDVGLDPTGISGLFFARYSMLYAGRNNLRVFFLNRFAPGYSQTLHEVTNRSGKTFDSDDILKGATERLGRLRELCSRYNVRFEFLLPPGFGSGSESLVQAGDRAGTVTWIPVEQNAWGQDWFKDGVHLKPEGTARFTAVLAGTLLQEPSR